MLELNLEKKQWEIVEKLPAEVIQEKTIGEKVKGLFNWFGNSPSNQLVTKNDMTNVPPRQRNYTFH